MQNAFDELKMKLTTAPVLEYLDHSKPFVLCTDTSSKAAGTVISQAYENGRDHPMHYASRALSKVESRDSEFEIEALGVFFALKKSVSP